MFEKSLTDVIRGIRAHPGDEVSSLRTISLFPYTRAGELHQHGAGRLPQGAAVVRRRH